MCKPIDSLVEWLSNRIGFETREIAFDTPLDDTLRQLMHAWGRHVQLPQGDWEALCCGLYSNGCRNHGAKAC